MPPCSYSACSGTVHVNTNLGIERYVHHCALPEDAPLVGGMRWLDSITSSVDMNVSKFQERVKDRKAWHAAVHGVTKSDMA